MTLAVGDHVVKLDKNTGLPVKEEHEVHIEFEVTEIVGYDMRGTDHLQTVKLKKVR